jgi:hypothetical protein
MKNLLFISICFICLIACGNRNKQSEVQESEVTFEEYAINILKLYQDVDPQLTAERNEIYRLILKHTDPQSEAGTYLLHNIEHIDSIVNQSVALVKDGEIEDLYTLLKGEIMNFYAHPHNTVDNEMLLHRLIGELYYQTTDSYEEFVKELIYLNDFTIMHMEALIDKHPEYITILIEQAGNCIEVGFYDKAIIYGDKLCSFMKKHGEVEGQIYSAILLAKVHKKAGNIEQSNNIIDSVKHLPQYTKCCEAVKQIGIFED